MKNISLNERWKCKPDFNDVGIENQWYNPKNFASDDKELIDIIIPKCFNTLKGYEIFEGVFWHYYTLSFYVHNYIHAN